MAQLEVWLLGAPRIESGGEAIDVDTRKATALLAYMALNRDIHRRDSLAAIFWPEGESSRARTALRRTLSTLNKGLGKGFLYTDRENAGLADGIDIWLDVTEFHTLLNSCRESEEVDDPQHACDRCLPALEKAVALYRDDFMAGFGLRDSAEFDEWQFFQAEGLRQELASALRRLVRCYVQRKEYEAAIEHARRWLALDPLHEPVHRHLMQLYAWAGRRAAALRQYQECTRVLEEELGAFPLEETIQLYDQIREKRLLPPQATTQRSLFLTPDATAGSVAADRPTLPAMGEMPTHNLPHQPTPFVGREQEQRQIVELIRRDEVHLLTLVGPGGIGKTRLALQVAGKLIDSYPQGVFFVPLATVNAPDYLVSTIAESLHFPFYGREEHEAQLLNYLREKEMLLVLDNFEHLLSEVDFIDRILQTAPQVNILITSQERLNLQEEWLFELGGLTFPENGSQPGGATFSAVELFTQRAHKVHPTLEFNEEDLTAVAHICRLVAGLPLGVELAAAWVRVLSCRDIAQEIESNLDFLSTSLHDVPQRHRSLRAVFDRSWELLTPRERTVFRQLTVFGGPFLREAAVDVAGADLPLLLSLSNKSFVRRSSSGRGEIRYEVPGVLTVYAEEQGASGDEEVGESRREARRRHAAYYANFLQERETALRGGDQKRALEEIAAEIGNIRTVWERMVAATDADGLNKSLESLYRFYELRSWFVEGETVFAQAAEQLRPVQGQHPLLLARLLARHGRFAVRLSHNDAAHQALTESSALLESLDQPREKAAILSNLGILREAAGEYDEARRLQEESLVVSRRSGDVLGQANALTRLGNVAISVGEYPLARRYYEEGRSLYQQIRYSRGIALCLNNLGGVADKEGDYARARLLYEESLDIKHSIGDRRGIAFSLNNLGYISFLQGKLKQARPYLVEGYRLFKEIGDRRGMGYTLNNLGNVARGMADFETARQNCVEALGLFRQIGDMVGIAFAQNDLGHVHFALGEAETARAHFQAALQTAIDIRAIPVVLDALLGMAQVRHAQEDDEAAATLLGFILEQDALQEQGQRRATALLAEITDQWKPEKITAVRTAGAAQKLDDVVSRLLAPW